MTFIHFLSAIVNIHYLSSALPLFPGMVQIDMEILSFVFQGVFPVFLLVVCGWYLKHKGIIGEGFLKSSSNMSFRLAIPALAFLKIASLDFSQVFIIKEILLICLIHIAVYLTAFLLVLKLGDKRQKGVIVQGSFRGNVVIVGIALILNLYGEEMMARSAMSLAFLLPLFNVLGVIALTLPIHGMTTSGIVSSLKNIAKNPLILTVIAAMIFSLLRISIPPIMERFLSYLADLALPLALITIGGSLTARGIRDKGKLALMPTILKLVMMPIAGVIVFYLIGYRGDELGMIFLLLGAPTAVSSHVMADALDNDGELAALVVMFTTAGAGITTLLGISLIEKML